MTKVNPFDETELTQELPITVEQQENWNTIEEYENRKTKRFRSTRIQAETTREIKRIEKENKKQKIIETKTMLEKMKKELLAKMEVHKLKIGKQCTVGIHGFKVNCKILDYKYEYGHHRFFVIDIGTAVTAWINENKIIDIL